MPKAAILRTDSKGRITLGVLSKGVSSYHAVINEDRSILLEPYTEIPLREKWIYDNPDILKKIQNGLEESLKGQARSLGSFTKYVND